MLESITLSASKKTFRQRTTAEAGLFFGLLFVGIVLVPIAIYWVGGSIFGEYGGHGYGDFFGSLSDKIRNGDRVSWFLVLSPYLAILTIRLTVWGWRRTL